MYNLKVLNYPNSKEYRIYFSPIEENRKSNDDVKRIRWNNELDDNGNRVSYDDNGNYRNQEDTDRCFNISQKRSKQTIIEYARANNWDWFITLTFNPDLVDSTNYDDCYKKVHIFFNNLKKRKCPDIKYLIVPEQHKSGRWHFHGLISGSDDLSLGISHFKGSVYNIHGFKYGYTTATKVKDTKRVSTYISKYITKETADLTVGRHRYIKSNNLNKADVCDYNISCEELEALKLDLISQGAYFKEVQSPQGIQKVMYINIDE